MSAAVAARAVARPKGRVNALLSRPKTVEKVMERRARGETSERIAQALRLVVADVSDIIQRRRRAGDVRGLTDCQARVTARLARFRAEPPAEPVAPPPPLPSPPAEIVSLPAPPTRRVPRIVAPAIHPEGLGDYIARLHRCAAIAAGHPDAAAGLRHLADLHEHCSTLYPNYVVPSENTTFELTRQRFPDRRHEIGCGGSPAQICAEA